MPNEGQPEHPSHSTESGESTRQIHPTPLQDPSKIFERDLTDARVYYSSELRTEIIAAVQSLRTKAGQIADLHNKPLPEIMEVMGFYLNTSEVSGGHQKGPNPWTVFTQRAHKEGAVDKPGPTGRSLGAASSTLSNMYQQLSKEEHQTLVEEARALKDNRETTFEDERLQLKKFAKKTIQNLCNRLDSVGIETMFFFSDNFQPGSGRCLGSPTGLMYHDHCLSKVRNGVDGFEDFVRGQMVRTSTDIHANVIELGLLPKVHELVEKKKEEIKAAKKRSIIDLEEGDNPEDGVQEDQGPSKRRRPTSSKARDEQRKRIGAKLLSIWNAAMRVPYDLQPVSKLPPREYCEQRLAETSSRWVFPEQVSRDDIYSKIKNKDWIDLMGRAIALDEISIAKDPTSSPIDTA